MILDKGFCTVYGTTNNAFAGNMPTDALTLKFQSWYGELNFETSPAKPTEFQQDVEISARIRIIQNRLISNHDVALLSIVLPPPIDAVQFEIIRAYHGIDDENGQPITDLSLREVQQQYDLTAIP